jgi:hypothetical protein
VPSVVVHRPLPDQLHEGLVDEGGRLERETRGLRAELLAELRSRHPLEIGVDRVHQRIEGPVPAGLDVAQEQRDLLEIRHRMTILRRS